MRSLLASSDGVAGRADSLEDEEDAHAGGGDEEEQTATSALDAEGGSDSPAQVPDSEDTASEMSE